LQAADALPDALQEAVRAVDGLATGFVVETMDATAADFEVVILSVDVFVQTFLWCRGC